jgi:hypothetical protein
MGMNPRLLRPLASRRFLMDVYGPALYAYSLRRLRSGYSGPVVQVRRTNDNAEANFTADEVSNGTLAAWVGSGNDGRVKTWYDQSPSGFHVEQATSGNQPTIVASGALVTDGGLPAILNASGQGLRRVVSYSASLHVVFAVATSTSTTGNRRLIQAESEQMVLRSTTGSQAAQMYGAGGLSPTNSSTNTFATNARAIASGVYNHAAGTMQGFLNATQNITFTGGAGGTASATAIGVLAVNATPAEVWIGRCSEIIVYTTDVIARRANIVTDMNRHYGVF